MNAGRPTRSVRLARRALDAAIVLAGIGFSVGLLTHSSLAKGAIWLAVFIAVTAFAVLQRETQR